MQKGWDVAANRVLIIDDDPDVRVFLQALLEGEGYEVSTAADGGEGLALQRKRPAHVVVTDIFMPGKEGIETIHQFHGEFPQAKIIVISGGPVKKGTDYLSVARELGAARSLKKPLVTQELIDAVRELSALHS
jgi:DNA-binding NtrC family response regulator